MFTFSALKYLFECQKVHLSLNSSLHDAKPVRYMYEECLPHEEPNPYLK